MDPSELTGKVWKKAETGWNRQVVSTLSSLESLVGPFISLYGATFATPAKHTTCLNLLSIPLVPRGHLVEQLRGTLPSLSNIAHYFAPATHSRKEFKEKQVVL